MKKYYIVLSLLLALFVLTNCNFDGLRWWNKNKYFQTKVTEKKENFEDIKDIGIYVFSDGETINGSEKVFRTEQVINSILLFIYINRNLEYQIGFDPEFFSFDVTTETTFKPDSSNAGPSLELAIRIEEELRNLGYNPKIITDMGHSKEVTFDRCYENAKSNKFDAMMVVNYSALRKWTEFKGTDLSYVGDTRVIKTNINLYEGFLYLPNAALFNVKDRELLWKSSFYGLVENAHFFNITGVPFNKVCNECLITKGSTNYIEASKKAVNMIFKPEYWPESFKPLPEKGKKKKKL